MAQKKVTDLTTITAITTDDVIYVIDDPGGSPASRQISFDDLQKSISQIAKSGDTVTLPGTLNVQTELQEKGNRVGPIETGTFTPVLEGSNTAGSHSYNTQNGFYYRQGNVVHIIIRIKLSSYDSGADGSALITGLPFSIAALSGAFTYLSGRITGWGSFPSDFLSLLPRLDNGASQVQFLYLQNTGSAAGLLVDEVGSGSTDIRLSGTYRIA